MLLEAGADIWTELPDDGNHRTAMFYAMRHNRPHFIHMIAQYDTEENRPDWRNHGPDGNNSDEEGPP